MPDSDFDFPGDREGLIHVGDFLGDVFDEVVEEPIEEMILGPAFLSYSGEPEMDAGALEMWASVVGARMEIGRLTFNGENPFQVPFGLAL